MAARALSALLVPALASGAMPLWGSARLLSRPVAVWELRPFFEQRDDRDMQQQLMGSAARSEQSRLYLSLGAALAIGGSLGIGDLPLPDSLRLPLSAGAAAAPFALLGVSIARPDALRVALSTAALLSPERRRRLVYHEAGHFLVGHLIGLRVEAYTVGAAGSAVRFSAQGAAVGADLVDAIACVSMAGIAAEVVACGAAEGGREDLAQLRAAFLELAPRTLGTTRQQDDRIRWATMMALTLITRHRDALDVLAAAFERGSAIDECIVAIEGTVVDKKAGRQTTAPEE
jgi:hypothetical protein